MASCGTITVLPQFDVGNVTATCNISNEQPTPNSTTTVNVTIENANDARAAYSLELTAGSLSGQRSGTVSANSTTSEAVSFTFPEKGDYPVELSLSAQRA